MKSLVDLSILILLLLIVGCGPQGEVLAAVPTDTFSITEIMAWPNSGRSEWIEVGNTGTTTADLYGCIIRDGGNTSHVDWIGTHRRLAPGEFAVLSKDTELVAGHISGIDIRLFKLSLVNEGVETVRLSCPDGNDGWNTQDEVMWGPDANAPVQGRSWSRALDVNETGIAVLDRWCLPRVEDTYYIDPMGVEDRGTPGAPSSCGPAARLPRPGQVVLNEVMIAPATNARDEWLELENLTTESLDLMSCLFAIETPEGDIKIHRFADGDGRAWLDAREYLVLGRGSNRLLPDDGLLADHAWGNLGLPNGVPFQFTLACPDPDGVGDGIAPPGWYEIVHTDFDWEAHQLPKGFSLRRDGWNWCGADPTDILYDDGWGSIAVGTPGAANGSCP